MRASNQRLVAVDLHRGRGRQLMAAGRRLQPPAVPLVDHVPAGGRRVGSAVDGQRRDVVMQRAILMINPVRIGGRRLDRRDRRHALVAARRGVRVDRVRLDLTTTGARIEDRRGGRAVRIVRGRRRRLGLPLGWAAAARRGRVDIAGRRQYRAGRQHIRARMMVARVAG